MLDAEAYDFLSSALADGNWKFAAEGIYVHGPLFALLLSAAAALVHTGVEPAAVDHLRSAWLQGQVHMRKGEYRSAEEKYRNALEHSPGDADIHSSLGAAFAEEARLRRGGTER